MAVVRSVAVENLLGTSTTPFWSGGGRKQLNVAFGADSEGTCNVWGIDPDNDNEVVFNGILWTSQQDYFIEAVRIGRPGQLVTNENDRYLVPLAPEVPGPVTPSNVDQVIEPPDGYAVVISGGSPPPP